VCRGETPASKCRSICSALLGSKGPEGRDEGPYNEDTASHQDEVVSMYVDLLSTALDAWVDQLSDDDLLAYALERRAEMLKAYSRPEMDVYDVIAAEISYDCALVKLCERQGMDVSILRFRSPRAERARVERRLAAFGTNLASLAKEAG